MVLQRQPTVAVHDREQHGEPGGIEPLRDTPRVAEAHRVDQALYLDQQRPPALAGHGDDAARRDLLRPREEDRRGVGDLAQTVLDHREEGEFIGRPEAVLGGAHDSPTGTGVALKVKHRID